MTPTSTPIRLASGLLATALASCTPLSNALGAAHATKSQDPMLASGTYRIEGHPMADGCGGQVYLAARHIAIDVAGGRLDADVVDRNYRLRVEGGTIVAEGDFDESPDCAGPDVHERWTLHPAGEGRLRGELESSWSLAPACGSRCTITFSLSAVRAR